MFLHPNLCTHIFLFLVWGGVASRMNQGRCLLSNGLLGICGTQKVHEEWSWGVLQRVKKSLGEDVWWWMTHRPQTFTNDPWHLSFIFGFLRAIRGTWLEESLGPIISKGWGTQWTQKVLYDIEDTEKSEVAQNWKRPLMIPSWLSSTSVKWRQTRVWLQVLMNFDTVVINVSEKIQKKMNNSVFRAVFSKYGYLVGNEENTK